MQLQQKQRTLRYALIMAFIPALVLLFGAIGASRAHAQNPQSVTGVYNAMQRIGSALETYCGNQGLVANDQNGGVGETFTPEQAFLTCVNNVSYSQLGVDTSYNMYGMEVSELSVSAGPFQRFRAGEIRRYTLNVAIKDPTGYYAIFGLVKNFGVRENQIGNNQLRVRFSDGRQELFVGIRGDNRWVGTNKKGAISLSSSRPAMQYNQLFRLANAAPRALLTLADYITSTTNQQARIYGDPKVGEPRLQGFYPKAQVQKQSFVPCVPRTEPAPCGQFEGDLKQGCEDAFACADKL